MDKAELSIWQNRFMTITRKMLNTLFRTGRSGVINTAHDCSCAILTADGRLITAVDSLLIHVMAGPDMMARSIVDLHDDIRPGDAYLHNCPYHGNSHPADQSILIPVFDDDGKHRFTVLSKAHQADIGASMPTTYSVEARDVYEEGALLFPAMRVQRDFRDIEDIIRMCRMRIRVPDQWYADYLSLIGAARIAEQELKAAGRAEGWDRIDEIVEAWFDHSENVIADAIAGLPEGQAAGRCTHDPFPGIPDGLEITSKITVSPDRGRIAVDLTENPDCLRNGLNLSEACSRTAALIGVFNGLGLDIPVNHGSFRRIDIKLRQGCCVGIPTHPHSCSVATTNVSDRVINATQRAFADLKPGLGMAEAGAVIPPAGGVISGLDPATGKPFINKVLLGLTAGQASPRADGWLTAMHAGSSGMCRHDSVEIDEMKYPIRVWSRRLETDSEGAGEFTGAPSARVEFGPVGCDFDIMYAADGREFAAKGVAGGLPGRSTDCLKLSRDGMESELPSYGRIRIEEGERIISLSPGGGGYGLPQNRSPERLGRQIRDGLISPERASSVYGFIQSEEGVVTVDASGGKAEK